jgi:hypothetical protein
MHLQILEGFLCLGFIFNLFDINQGSLELYTHCYCVNVHQQM